MASWIPKARIKAAHEAKGGSSNTQGEREDVFYSSEGAFSKAVSRNVHMCKIFMCLFFTHSFKSLRVSTSLLLVGGDCKSNSKIKGRFRLQCAPL